MGTLYQITGMLSESFQKQSPYSYYSKEQAELLAQTPDTNKLPGKQYALVMAVSTWAHCRERLLPGTYWCCPKSGCFLLLWQWW